MLDEVAQYATRLHAVQPDGGGQLAAFLMSLHGYARDHEGVAVVLTLASQKDAFARETGRIRELLKEALGREASADEAACRTFEGLEDTARQVQAMRILRERPQDYGITPAKLTKEFEGRKSERENALVTAVTQAYSSLWFPTAKTGQVVRREIKTAGGEGRARPGRHRDVRRASGRPAQARPQGGLSHRRAWEEASAVSQPGTAAAGGLGCIAWNGLLFRLTTLLYRTAQAARGVPA